jgi:hypothetical protein
VHILAVSLSFFFCLAPVHFLGLMRCVSLSDCVVSPPQNVSVGNLRRVIRGFQYVLITHASSSRLASWLTFVG